MDFDTAKRLAVAKFMEIHPIESLPDWVDRSITIGGTVNFDKMWQIEFTICEKEPLRENEFWEERNGRKVLMKMDPSTGQKMVILSRRQEVLPIVAFRVLIDPNTSAVGVLIDSNFEEMDGDAYERVGG